MAEKLTDEKKALNCQKILAVLKEDRKSVEPMIEGVISFVNHGRRLIDDKNKQKGNKTGADVYDGTALSAANLAADGIHGYLCAENIHWFDFVLPKRMRFSRTSGMRAWDGKRLDEYPEVKVWLDDCEDCQYTAFSNSNFYNFSPEFIKEGITIGTATAVIEENFKTGKIIFTNPHFREIYIAENWHGIVDTSYREYKVTLRQMVQKWGEDLVFSLKQDFKHQYEQNPYMEVEIVHAVFPRDDYIKGQIGKKNKPVVSMWLLPEATWKLIEESGYNDTPRVTWRWRKNSDERYGRSPAWDAYVDIMKANQQARTNLVAGHKMVEPPYALPETLRGKFRDAPKGKTYIPGGVTKDKIPVPLNTGIQLPYGIEQQERTEKIIKEYFHTDFFLMLYQAAFNKVELTATQVIGMQSEQAAVLGTRIGRFQHEGLKSIHDRVWNIEIEAGRMPNPPDIVLEYAGGEEVKIEYRGPLAQSQRRLFVMQGINAGVEMAARIATIYPPAIDRLDGDQMMIEGMESVGLPAKCLRDDDAVEKIRTLRQQQEQNQLALEQAGEMAKAVPKLSKTPEEGSPLALLTEGS